MRTEPRYARAAGLTHGSRNGPRDRTTDRGAVRDRAAARLTSSCTARATPVGWSRPTLREPAIGWSRFSTPRPVPDSSCTAFPCIVPQTGRIERGRPTLDVVVAVHNYGVDMVALLAEIGGLGFRRTLNMIHFHNLFPEGQPFRFWLAPRTFYREREREIEAARSLLGDATSRRWFDYVLAFRLTGDYGRLPSPSATDQYFPADLPRWKSPMRYRRLRRIRRRHDRGAGSCRLSIRRDRRFRARSR